MVSDKLAVVHHVKDAESAWTVLCLFRSFELDYFCFYVEFLARAARRVPYFPGLEYTE